MMTRMTAVNIEATSKLIDTTMGRYAVGDEMGAI
jgi:hypothetical protein